MPETEPLYFKEFRSHIDSKFDEVNRKFDEVNSNVNELAISTAKQFLNIDFRFDEVQNEMAQIKDVIEKI